LQQAGDDGGGEYAERGCLGVQFGKLPFPGVNTGLQEAPPLDACSGLRRQELYGQLGEPAGGADSGGPVGEVFDCRCLPAEFEPGYPAGVAPAEPRGELPAVQPGAVAQVAELGDGMTAVIRATWYRCMRSSSPGRRPPGGQVPDAMAWRRSLAICRYFGSLPGACLAMLTLPAIAAVA
jgi:hypothetical protein